MQRDLMKYAALKYMIDHRIFEWVVVKEGEYYTESEQFKYNDVILPA